MEKVRRLNHGPLQDRCLEAVYREPMSGSFAPERPLKCGFLAPTGSFSHLGCVRTLGATLAAQIYGLRVLFKNIEDNPDNVTRFFVIGRDAAKKTGEDKTAIMSTTANKPGALAEVLDVFKENGINLENLQQRPSKKVNWEYVFFIDATGHADDMQRAIAEAQKHCLQLTVLGSYPKAR